MSDNPIEPTTENQGRTILCIEDERFIAELYARALTKAGYQVTVITDGAEGLKEAQTNKYDLILLDLMIPNVTGIEILRALRDPARVPPLRSKIIVATNLEQRADVRTDIETQADGFVVKAEMTPHELVNFINNVR